MSSTRWHPGDRSQYCASADAPVRMLTSLCQDSQAGLNAKIVFETTELAFARVRLRLVTIARNR